MVVVGVGGPTHERQPPELRDHYYVRRQDATGALAVRRLRPRRRSRWADPRSVHACQVRRSARPRRATRRHRHAWEVTRTAVVEGDHRPPTPATTWSPARPATAPVVFRRSTATIAFLEAVVPAELPAVDRTRRFGGRIDHRPQGRCRGDREGGDRVVDRCWHPGPRPAKSHWPARRRARGRCDGRSPRRLPGRSPGQVHSLPRRQVVAVPSPEHHDSTIDCQGGVGDVAGGCARTIDSEASFGSVTDPVLSQYCGSMLLSSHGAIAAAGSVVQSAARRGRLELPSWGGHEGCRQAVAGSAAGSRAVGMMRTVLGTCSGRSSPPGRTQAARSR